MAFLIHDALSELVVSWGADAALVMHLATVVLYLTVHINSFRTFRMFPFAHTILSGH